MNSQIGEIRLLLVVLVLTGAASWWLMLRSVSQTDPVLLDGLASSLGGWQAIDIEIDQSVSDMLDADHNVQRAYHHPLGYSAFLYIGYYGPRRGGTPEHTPDVCYPAQGWAIVEDREREVGGRDGLRVREYIVEKEDARRLVHYWYRSRVSSGITSIFGLRISHFWARLTNQGNDGALVRLSAPLPDGELASARERLLGLDRLVEAELDRVWPRERSRPGSAQLSGLGS